MRQPESQDESIKIAKYMPQEKKYIYTKIHTKTYKICQKI